MRWRRAAAAAVAAVAVATVSPTAGRAGAGGVPTCASGGPPVIFTGSVAPADAKTYLVQPFDVVAGTTRVEVSYSWADNPVLGLPGAVAPSTPLTQTVLDLGLWDDDGYRSVEGFRGWSGSRGGRSASKPVFVQRDIADRGYLPGPIEAGTWWVDLGIAAVGPTGATWQVTVRCSSPAVGAPFVSHPVDAAHLASTAAGWYHGDFHMHGVHSNASAPSWDEMVAYARSVGLDFLPITDYVTTQHWRELGPVQEANPDLVIWPGREIITYFGHANALGETPSVAEYRHGFEDVTLRGIQEATVADGALFQVNHPTTFPGPVFANFCRGCEFELDDQIDWSKVTTMEVLTGPILVSSAEIGLPGLPVMIQNPFTQPAIDQWEALLRAGHRITGVSGSDSKGVEGEARRMWGTNATAVYATSLSRAALMDALRAGHAYVRTRGVHGSPEVSVTARTADGRTAMVGDTLNARRATVTVRVRGGDGQRIQITRDGDPYGLPVLVRGDDFTYRFTARRDAGSGPLGTFWRVDTADLRSLTTIGNPIFLAG
jgi:hypothetical protein